MNAIRRTLLFMFCMLLAGAATAAEEPSTEKSPTWERPASLDTREYGRVSEEVMMIGQPAVPGDVILIVERLSDEGDRVRYYQYTALKDDFVTVTMVEKSINTSEGIDRVEKIQPHTLPLDFTDQTSMNITDFYGTPMKVVLTRAGDGDGLKVQTVRERSVVKLEEPRE